MLGQAVSIDWGAVISQFGLGALFCYVCWYLLSKHIPKIEERHEAERKAFLDSLDRMSAKHREERKEWLESHHKQMAERDQAAREVREEVFNLFKHMKDTGTDDDSGG